MSYIPLTRLGVVAGNITGGLSSGGPVVCYTAVFSVITQRSSPLTAAENRTVSGEERCVTTLKTAV